LAPTTTTTTTTTVTAGLTLTGDAYANTLTGGEGNDTIDGKAGADKLYGAGGNDVLIGGPGGDRLDGGAGVDTVSYATATAAVTASLASPASNRGDAYGDTYFGVENLTGGGYGDTLTGDNAINILVGGAGADRLYGAGGNDTLRGDAGNDSLFGGLGADSLYGGAGSDFFVFQSLNESSSSARDIIYDFAAAASDKIDLRGIDANSNASYNQAFAFIGGGAFTGTAGQLNFVNGVVSGDVNGDRMADFQINVTGVSSLSATDFYL
jgi:serralysin